MISISIRKVLHSTTLENVYSSLYVVSPNSPKFLCSARFKKHTEKKKDELALYRRQENVNYGYKLTLWQ